LVKYRLEAFYHLVFVCTYFFAWGNRPARSVIELAEKVRIDLARPIEISDLLQAKVLHPTW
jgi:hypothetical protein